MTLMLKPYQKECMTHAIAQKTIVNLPTGLGKTLISVKVIDHFLQQYPTKRIAFLAHTRPLVTQQSEYLIKHCKTRY